jgi:hypothetical protein
MMPKRSLRVVKFLVTIPAVGVCTYCAGTFEVPLVCLKNKAAAQESLLKQFEKHRCNLGNTSQANGRYVFGT